MECSVHVLQLSKVERGGALRFIFGVSLLTPQPADASAQVLLMELSHTHYFLEHKL